jgi:hypothetical protein
MYQFEISQNYWIDFVKQLAAGKSPEPFFINVIAEEYNKKTGKLIEQKLFKVSSKVFSFLYKDIPNFFQAHLGIPEREQYLLLMSKLGPEKLEKYNNNHFLVFDSVEELVLYKDGVLKKGTFVKCL